MTPMYDQPMHVKIILPTGIFLEEQAIKVVGEAKNGCFCLLPRHIDMVTALTSGIFTITPVPSPKDSQQNSLSVPEEEIHIALDEGILVKRGSEVSVSAWNAVRGPLGELHKMLQAQRDALGEHELNARLALEHLEASLVRQVLGRSGGSDV